tara:strand:+ start:1075 stop:1353 length:279 start_codon:yes stop_codon:yes gene_type:complete
MDVKHIPALKPIRIPQSICEEDREYLARRRIRQNFSHQASIYILECIRKHDDIPPKYWINAIDAMKSYFTTLENKHKEQIKKEQLLEEQTND